MHPSFSKILRLGMAAGLLAGLAAALIALLLVEIPIRAALGIEEARSHAAGEHAHEELFSRPTQVVGGMLAAVVVGLAIGTIFAIVFASMRHRMSASTDFGRSVQLAAAGFTAVSLLPALKYPANPPGVGEPDTVTDRTLAYFSLIAAGIVIMYAAHYAHRQLAARGWQPPSAGTAAVALGVVLAGIVLWVWPANPDPIPTDIPAALLWQFRLSSLAELAGLWTVLGFAFGLLNTPRKARTQSRVTISPA